ncbi:MAG: MFS transporter [Candidatus Micrarchaeaceae archaeon]
MKRPKWMNRDVLLLSFSAFFADLGYQTAVALLPIIIVAVLGASALIYGITTAVAFGVGSLFGYIGGIMSTKYNDKYIAILGNSLIPMLSLLGLANSVFVAVALFCGGWWARNFRSPARRKLIVKATTVENRVKAFGFLHALDVGGGALSIIILLVLLFAGISIGTIVLLTAIPILISTILIVFTSASNTKPKMDEARKRTSAAAASTVIKGNLNAYRGILFATALYGFSSYTFGFPILTILQKSTVAFAVLSYGIFLSVSAVAGYLIGIQKWNKIKALSLAGYIASGIGALILALAYAYNLGIFVLFSGVAVLGLGMGAIETLEPTIISIVRSIRDVGKGMGALAGSRSFGIFIANIVMGILYVFSPVDSYIYAAVLAILAGLVISRYGSGYMEKSVR